MTETIIVSKENEAHFKMACRRSKIDFELTGEGIDGDTYTVRFEFAGELYFLGREVQMMIAEKKMIDKFL